MPNKTVSTLTIDAANKPVGRVASTVARVLLGKDSPSYAPNRATARQVVVIGTDQMVFTGKKIAQKSWLRHSGYHGGLRKVTASKLMTQDSRLVLRRAVYGMLPPGRLRRQRLAQLELHRD
ncbi:50S ribosomal protein L13 [Candidatus Parcubacteria bacterium]|nr:50S ribosomal protein L13 [Candidatus Parcubacteria bacterium]